MDVVVIGAGHAGMAVSQQLAQAGVEHVVLERGGIAESWRNHRWDTFTLNTPTWMNRMPGDSDADVGKPADGFMTTDLFVNRLERYANAWQLPIRDGVEVTKVETIGDGGSYRLHVRGAMSRPIDCSAVVVASGAQNIVKVPPIATAFPRSVLQVPSLGYRRPDQLPAGAVLVVGGGQTGAQIAEDLITSGRTVFWSVSKVTRAPRRYRGRDILEWLEAARFYDQPTEQVEDPAVMHAAMPIISGVGRYGHTVSLQWLASRGVKLIGRITAVDGEVLELDDSVAECIRFGDQRSAELRKLVDESIERRGEPLPPLEPDEADEPHPDPDSVRSPDRLDLPASSINTVIWCTGVKGDFNYLPDEAVSRAGMPLHEGGVSALDGLYFVGLPWQTRRGSGIINGIIADAESIATHVSEYLSDDG